MNAGRLVRALLQWFDRNARDLPWRHSDDPYAIWISEIMLQQTQVKTVIPYWKRWMHELPTVKSLARARTEKVLKLWEGLGYYTRARNLRKAAHVIVRNHHGRFPERFEDMLDLPGVGRYTAGAIASIAFNQAVPVLDGNVTRVLARIFGITKNPKERQTAEKLWGLAELLVGIADEQSRHSTRRADDAERNCSHLNQALMELGAMICVPRQPKCLVCPVHTCCRALRLNLTDQIPNPGKKIASTKRRFATFVVERNNLFLVRRRPAGVVNAGLWEFPGVELTGRRSSDRQIASALFGAQPTSVKRLHQIRHTITRYRITMDVLRAEFADGNPPGIPDGRWCSPAGLNRLAFPSAHKKILSLLVPK